MMSGMKFTHSVRYDAPAADVFAMLASPSFREKSSARMGVLSADIQVTTKGEGFSMVIDQVQATEGIPSFARKITGDTTRAIQREEWADACGGSLEIETPGKPTSLKGRLSLSEYDGVTTETMAAEIKVKVPLIGAKLEALMSDLIKKGMEKEHEAGVEWLGGER